MPSRRSRILIADDHKLMAELCRGFLEPEFDVIGTVGNGQELLRMAVSLEPDVVLLDIGMPVLNGLDAGKQLKALLPAVKLVFLTMITDPEVALQAFDRGASAFLLKTCVADEVDPLFERRYEATHFSHEI